MSIVFAIRVTPRAAADIRRAAEWWQVNRPSAPGAVHQEFAEACRLLQSQPLIGAKAEGLRLVGVRRFHLSRIHYFLYYRVVGHTVQVLALWHTSRGSNPPI